MIQCENLTFDYENKRALDKVSFTIPHGTITALVGANGAGKTTLLRTLAALDTPVSGAFFMNGIEGQKYPRKIHKLCSFLSDFYGLYDALSVTQCLTFTALSYHIRPKEIQSRIKTTLKQVQLEAHADKAAKELSRGLRQRLAIAQSIIHQPPILFLDEPASGLDPEARVHLSHLLKTLQKEGMTIIVSSHILSELEDYSTHMLMIKNGKIVKFCALEDVKKEQKSKLLRLSFDEINESILQALNDISNITVQQAIDNTVIVEFSGPQKDRGKLLKELVNKDIPVCGIEEIKVSMSEVYLNANKEESKDHDTE